MNLRVRLSLLFVLLATVPLVLVSYLGFLNEKQSLERKTIEQLTSVVELQQNRVSDLLDRYIEQVKLIGSRSQLRLSLAEFLSTGDLSEINRVTKIIRDASDSAVMVQEVSILDLKGLIVASTNDDKVGTLVKNEEMIAQGLRSSMLYDIVKDSQNNLTVQLIGPLKLEGELLGILDIRTSIVPILRITDDYSGLGQTGETLIVKRNMSGDALFITPLRFDGGAALTRGVSRQNKNVPVTKALLGENTALLEDGIIDYRGNEVFAVTRYIEALDWGVVVKIDKDEALSPIENIKQASISVIGLTILLLVFIAITTAQRLSSPIVQLTLLSENLRKGNFSMRSEVNRVDEIGTLANSLNAMAKQFEKLYEDLDKQVEERTKDLEKFKLAIENSTEQVIITDAKGIIIYANSALERTTGYTVKESLGTKAGVLWGGLMDDAYYKKLWDTVTNKKEVFTEQVKNKRKSGEEYFAAASLVPVLDKSGNVEFIVGIERDITKEKEVDLAKTEFVSLASHQLRTPLSAINWYTEMLLAGDAGKINKQQKEYLDQVYRGNKRMVDLVNALLNVSRIELGTFVVDPEKVDIKEIAETALKELQPKIIEKKLKIENNIKAKLPALVADGKLVRIIFQNLISNAVKYTPDKGSVTVAVSVKDAGTEFGGEKLTAKSFAIMVKDTGLGIPADQQNKIFSKLFRADNVKAADAEGTGLGLYIIKSILEHTSGSIWFESKEKKGTIFYVTMPVEGMKKRKGTKALS